MPKVHVITVHHRGKAMLQECLRSLLESSGVDLEIVVVSNNCQEELPPIIESASRIHLWVAPRNLGFSEANNAGVTWAQKNLGAAHYYYFINNDTASFSDSLHTLVQACEDEPEIGAVGPQLRILGAPDHLNSLGLNVTDDAWGWDEGIGIALADYGEIPAQRDVAALTGSALLMRSDVFAAISGWTEIYQYYFEDIDLCLKTWKHGWRVTHVPESIVLHQISATMSVGSEWKTFLFWRNRLFLALIHWPKGLLWSLAKRALRDEIWRRKRSENSLQRRAMWATLRRLPGLLRCRWRFRGDADWRRFLVPAGSGPVITLPETRDPFAESSDPSAAAASAGDNEGRPESAVDSRWGTAEDWRQASLSAVGAAPQSSQAAPPRRVLVIGWGPLPFEAARMNYAPGGRSWQLAQPLAEAGHRVCLATASMPGAFDDLKPDAGDPLDEADSTSRQPDEVRDGVLIYRLSLQEIDEGSTLEGLVAAFQPEVIVGAAAQPSRWASRLSVDLPLWVDLFGDPLAEAQAQSRLHADGDQVTAYWRMTADLLDRGDGFSAVSQRQAWAVVGQLGLAGRLNRQTCGHDLVGVIPCALPSLSQVADADSADWSATAAGRLLDEVGDDTFVVLWSGGFNTWCDIETLFAGLEGAMAVCPELQFVATGGHIKGQDEATFRDFAGRVEASSEASRFHLLGCLPSELARAWQRRADLAVVTERTSYERRLGSSGRLLGWLAQAVPFVCTRLSEVACQLAEDGHGRFYAEGDATDLQHTLVTAYEQRSSLGAEAAAAQEWAGERFASTTTVEPLLRFVAAARRAPDAGRQAHRYLAGSNDLVQQAELQAVRQQLTEQQAKAERFEDSYHQVRGELGAVHQSKMWKVWMAFMAPRLWLKSLLRRNDA